MNNIFSSAGAVKMPVLIVLAAFCATDMGVADGEEFVGGTFEGRAAVEWLDDTFIPTMR